MTDVRNDIIVRHPVSSQIPADADIRDDIRQSLVLDPDIDDSNIVVMVEAGWVTLRGTVPSLWQKDLAGDVAVTARGVSGLDNEIAVVPTNMVLDQTIANDVIAALNGTRSWTPMTSMSQFADGYVTLIGAVASRQTRDATYLTARHTMGVIDVTDNLIVRGE